MKNRGRSETKRQREEIILLWTWLSCEIVMMELVEFLCKILKETFFFVQNIERDFINVESNII